MDEQEWLSCTDPAAMLEFLRGKASDRKLRLFAVACSRQHGWRMRQAPFQDAVEVAERIADGNGTLAELETHLAWGFPFPAAAADPTAGANAAAVSRRWDVTPVKKADLVRDLFGNPFRPAALSPEWLAWKDGTVPKLAQAVYDGGRFTDLPILADALEDAGCTDAEILNHCRSGGEHVRGCWVVDLLLGKS
jgi:hypothetical protein